MSTLKVNVIEPYSGGTVDITGGTVASASYAETANTLTAGTKTITGDLNVNGNSILTNTAPGPNPLITAADDNGPKLIVSNDDGVPIFGANMVVNGTSQLNGDTTLNGQVTIEGDNTSPAETLNVKNGAGQTGLSVMNAQLAAITGVNVGVVGKLEATNINVTSDLTVTGSLSSNGNGIINGTNAGPGTTLDVRDGAGTPKLQVNNATLKGFVGVDVIVNGTAEIAEGLTLPGLGDYVDDAAAATGGVPVNGVYRTGSTLKIRVS